MKKLFISIVAVLFAATFTFAQTNANVDQTSPLNSASITQSDAGPSNVNGVTDAQINQVAVTSNSAIIDQLGRKSDIDLTQNAGDYNTANITQWGNYDNHFNVDQGATNGYNSATIFLGQDGGGDIHQNDYNVNQTAMGNNTLFITSAGNHVYSHNNVNITQAASSGNNSASLDMDGVWRRNIHVSTNQTSTDNMLTGTIRGEGEKVDIMQNANGTNYAEFSQTGNNHTLNVTQSTVGGNNSAISTQTGAGAYGYVNQTGVLGNNTAVINQHQ
jgi:hypothetical protein